MLLLVWTQMRMKVMPGTKTKKAVYHPKGESIRRQMKRRKETTPHVERLLMMMMV